MRNVAALPVRVGFAVAPLSPPASTLAAESMSVSPKPITAARRCLIMAFDLRSRRTWIVALL
jgi:hypothetical protein